VFVVFCSSSRQAVQTLEDVSRLNRVPLPLGALEPSDVCACEEEEEEEEDEDEEEEDDDDDDEIEDLC
jgi:hypothetical protein